MIPIEFDFQDEHYTGFLQPVSGSGGNSIYHLMIDGFYYGGLRKVRDRWILDSNPKSKGMEVLAEGFGKMIERRFEPVC
jgi:hypothetical protein